MAKTSTTTRVKDKGYVSPDEMLEYLTSKGVSKNHALGIVANVKYESNFNPNAVGDRGTSAGLFQHHASRKDNMMDFIGNDLGNWRKQVDFMLTESDTKRYLNNDFRTPEKASHWFTVNWERPANKAHKAVQRQAWIASYKGGEFSNGIYNPGVGEVKYRHKGNPNAVYKKDGDNWLINHGDKTNNKFVPIKDPTGSRSKELNKNASEFYSPPPEGFTIMSAKEANGLAEADYYEEDYFEEASDNVKEVDLQAAVQKEVKKIRDKEFKEQESLARQQVKALEIKKKKAIAEEAFFSAVDAIGDINTEKESNPLIANIGSFQGQNLPTAQQGLPTLPTLSSFEVGGVSGEEDEPPKELNKKELREQQYFKLLNMARGSYKHLNPENHKWVGDKKAYDFGAGELKNLHDHIGNVPVRRDGDNVWRVGSAQFTPDSFIDTGMTGLDRLKFDEKFKATHSGMDEVEYKTQLESAWKEAYDEDHVAFALKVDKKRGTFYVPVGTGPKSDKIAQGFINDFGDFKEIGSGKVKRYVPYFDFKHEQEGSSAERKVIEQQQRFEDWRKSQLGDFSGGAEGQEIGGEFIEGSSNYKNLFEFADGGTVSEVWKDKTGLPWGEAKSLGLTDGSYESNLLLRDRLNAGELNIKGGKKPAKQVTRDINSSDSFSEAFKIAREELGKNKTFKFNGRVYGTNLAGESFNPSDEELKKYNLNNTYTKDRLKEENKKVDSRFTSKEVVKLEPEYRDWESIKADQRELNSMSQADKIIAFKKKSNTGGNFAIVDKAKGLVHVYKPDGESLYSTQMDVAIGQNEGDAQTVTKYNDLNSDGKTNANEIYRANVDWGAGNMKTGAGLYRISNIDPEGYKNSPLLNMMNESQYKNYKETGKIENVSTSFHIGYVEGGDPRASSGCVRCNKPTLDNLINGLERGSEVYILPEEHGNEFSVVNNKIVFKPRKRGSHDYTDSRGKTQKGQGINASTSTLNYIPIIPEVDFDKIKLTSSGGGLTELVNSTISGLPYNESAATDAQKDRINIYSKTLSDKKRDIMILAGIDGDVYNEIAKMSFGIFGAESDYGTKFDVAKNAIKGAIKYAATSFDKESGQSIGGPDYQFESDFRTGDFNESGEDNSLGMTQLAFKNLDKEERKLLEKLGIYRPSQLTDPKHAATTTAALLAYRYNNRSFDVEGTKTRIDKDNMWELLPKTWNIKENYAGRVKDNAEAFSLKQLSDPKKIEQATAGYKQSDAFVRKYIKNRDLSPEKSKGLTNKKQIEDAESMKRMQAYVDRKPKTGLDANDPFYEQRRAAYIRSYGLDDKRDQVYEYSGRPGATYKKLGRQKKWFINLGEDTNNEFIPINDPEGTRKKVLDKQATIVGAKVAKEHVNKFPFEDGGVYELTDEEIQSLRDGGYIIEDID